MSQTIKFSLLLILTGISLTTHTASFDCSKAATNIEQKICSDSQLSELDVQLSRAYKRALDKTGSKVSVKEWQRYWLNFTRESCYVSSCLYNAYKSQILELNEHAEVATNTSGNSGISGKYVRFFQGSLDKNTATINVLELKNNRVRLIGDAFWIGNTKIGNIHIGQIDGLSLRVKNNVHYRDSYGCRFVINFIAGGLQVSNDNLRCGGVNVSFNGDYRKIEGSQ